jgi:hypothetical protein
MNVSDANFEQAKASLERNLIGRSICGLHFYGSLILLLDDHERGFANEAWLTVESNWGTTANTTWDGDHLTIDGLVAFAMANRRSRIESISLSAPAPHLLLTFDNGSHLHFNGSNPQFESWQLQCGVDLVVALPGDRVMVTT